MMSKNIEVNPGELEILRVAIGHLFETIHLELKETKREEQPRPTLRGSKNNHLEYLSERTKKMRTKLYNLAHRS